MVFQTCNHCVAFDVNHLFTARQKISYKSAVIKVYYKTDHETFSIPPSRQGINDNLSCEAICILVLIHIP